MTFALKPARKLLFITKTPLHYEDTTPLQLATGGVMASPTRNLLQQDLIALKLRARVAWAVLPGAIASVTGANW
jgi:hypothetical protein